MKRKPKAKAKATTKMKKESDIFICKRATGEYWAYPSPFVAHGPQAEIRFRNLTGDDITIDFGKFFTDPVQDWQPLLPYHRWLADEGDYLGYSVDGPSWQNHDDSQPVVLTTATGDEVELMGIDTIYEMTVYLNLEDSPVEYLDGPDGGGAQVIDPQTELPYLPDYTFDDLFPTMTRARWEPSWRNLVK